MKVRWSETALTEIENIFAYIHQRNRSAAAAVVSRIEGLTSLLGEYPLIGHLTDETDVRVLPVVRYPYLIFYAIDHSADEVVILHVRHGAQERP
jgi:addiction module RelE/StbE family toxin